VSIPADHGMARERSEAARKRSAVRIATAALGFAVLLALIVFVRRQDMDPWAWFAEVWVLIAAIPLPFVVVALAFKAAEVSLNAAAWKTVLHAAYPEQRITFRQMLGVVQGGVGIFAVVPPKFGGFAVLGLYRVAFPDLGITAVLATRVVQGISSTILGTVLLLLFGAVTAGIGTSGGFAADVATFFTERTVLAVALSFIVVALVMAALRYGRAWLRGFVVEMALGGAILRTPRRYLALVVFPTLLAFVLRWAVTGTLLAAFVIPVSFETLLRVNVSHGIARTVQVTPGGFGTTQAFDLVALRGVAPAEVITAYSLSQAAILLVFNIAFGLIALTWAFGWERTARLIRLPGRNGNPAPVPVG
jgi:uncharacterized membrane protein YbhN (UPF0104 family)